MEPLTKIPELMGFVEDTLSSGRHVDPLVVFDHLQIEELKEYFDKLNIPLPKSSKNREFYRKMMILKLVKEYTPKDNGLARKVSCKAIKRTKTYRKGELVPFS